jgi:4-aminobutyrate---pyruvate transaminase
MTQHESSTSPDTSVLDKRYHLHSQTNFAALQATGPLIIEKGDGVYVVDSNGNRYLEAMSGLWCASLGFSNERLINAATAQLGRLPYYHTFNSRSPDVASRLAGRIAEHSPIPDSRVYLASSGSEANESMVKFAWAYYISTGRPTKRKILSHNKGFHGSTIFAAGLAGLPNMHKAFGLPVEGIIHLRAPYRAMEGNAGETEAEFCARLLRELEDTILREGPDTIAALISEPVLGAGGVIVPPTGYFQGVQQILKKYDILMLADEIICGFGRTGEWFGSQTMGIQPDMMSCGKSLSAGYQALSCVVVGGHLYRALEDQSRALNGFGHGFTHSGHPVAAAVALEAVSIYESMDVGAHVRNRAEKLASALARVATHPLVGEIRQVGLMAAVELTSVEGACVAFGPESRIGLDIDLAARSRGLIIRAIGNQAIALCPPYIISDNEIEMLAQALEDALNDVWSSTH